jgi:hypothetical protein
MTSQRIAIAMAALGVAACTTTSSTGIATENLFVEYQVSRHDDQVTAHATFHVGNGNTGTVVRLGDEDAISCNGVPLAVQSSVAGQVWYESQVPTTTGPFIFQFERASGDIETSVAAPTALTMSSPAAGAMLSTQQPITVTWSPSGTAGRVDVSLQVESGSCTSRVLASNVLDTGSASIELDAPPDGKGCSGTLVVRRSLEAPGGAPFEGGRLITSSFDTAAVVTGP